MKRGNALKVSHFVLLIGLLVFTATTVGWGQVTLTWHNWSGGYKLGRAGIDAIVEEFEKINPDVKISLRVVPFKRARELLITSVAAGDAPDVAQFTAHWLPQIAEMGAFEPLEEYFSPEKLNQFDPKYIEAVKYKGRLYALPWHAGPTVLFRNINLIEKAGYSRNKIPQNWNEFTEMIKKIGALQTTEKGEKIYGIAARTSKDINSAFWTLPVIWGHGGKIIDDKRKVVFDSPPVVKAFKWYQDLASAEYMPKGQGLQGTRELFYLGRTGFVLEGPWMHGLTVRAGSELKLYKDYDVSLMPKGPDGISHTNDNGWVLVVLRQSKNKKLAAKFIEHATTSEKFRRIFWEKALQFVPPYKPHQVMDIAKEPYNQVFLKQMETANPTPVPHPKWLTALEFIAICMQKSILGYDVEAAVKETAENLQVLLK